VKKIFETTIDTLYIPQGKALIAVPVDNLNGCKGCYKEGTHCTHISCNMYEREDGVNINLKLVDYGVRN